MSSLTFTSSKIAAAALCYLSTPQLATQVSGYSFEDLQDCYDWMAAFAITVHEMGPMQLKSFSQVSQDDMHNIQTHSVDLETLVGSYGFSSYLVTDLLKCHCKKNISLVEWESSMGNYQKQ